MKHGGDLSEAIEQHGGPAEAWLDLSTGVNPNPWPGFRSLDDHVWQRLPGADDERKLIEAARDAYAVPEGLALTPAPGSQSIVQWLAHLAPPGAVAVVEPTYVEHSLAWEAAGHPILPIARPGLLPAGARHLILVNPNNPDGEIVTDDALARAGDEVKRRNGWMIVDEAFADVDSPTSRTWLSADRPIVVLRSFGKFYGLAGLRLGFAIGPGVIISRLRRALGPWAVSGPAIAIGTAALQDRQWAETARRALREQSAAALDAVLTAASLTIAGGTPLFRLARHSQAEAIHAHLAAEKIWVRRFDWSTDLSNSACRLIKTPCTVLPGGSLKPARPCRRVVMTRTMAR